MTKTQVKFRKNWYKTVEFPPKLKKILIFILVNEIGLYTGKSPLDAPSILWNTETVPYHLIL